MKLKEKRRDSERAEQGRENEIRATALRDMTDSQIDPEQCPEHVAIVLY